MTAQAISSGTAQARLLDLIHSKEAVSAEVLFPLYDQLEPISVEDILGRWKGGRFDGGKEPDPIRWYGKNFVSASYCEPLLARNEDGSVYAFDKLGAAQMRLIEWRGKVSASLIYDSQPIMDYFRKVTDDVIIGLGDVKGKPTDFFFHLTRE
ncbi:MAG: hypothetical protein RLZZ618_1529 [Pseudomonadota bacterium]|jgi:hypothetical protein